MKDLSPNPYLSHLETQLAPLTRDDVFARARIAAVSDIVLALALLDLEPARPLLCKCYDRDHHGGRRRRDPVTMLRALIVMAMLGEHRINVFVRRLHDHPELRVLCGFRLTDDDGEPDNGPGVGTFYDFIARQLDGPPPPRSVRARWVRPSTRRRGRTFLRHIDKEKLERRAGRSSLKRTRAVFEQVTRESAERGHTQRLDGFSGRMQQILAMVAVAPSAAKGLLPPLLDVAADGTVIRTQASPLGKEPSCEAEDGCRAYSDAEATWGFDARGDAHFFGHKGHAWVARAGKRDLPLWVDIDGAHEPDVVLAEYDLVDLVWLLGEHAPQSTLRSVAADAAYDAEAFYALVEQFDAAPIIALNPRHPLPTAPDLDENGVPLCPGGIAMRR